MGQRTGNRMIAQARGWIMSEGHRASLMPACIMIMAIVLISSAAKQEDTSPDPVMDVTNYRLTLEPEIDKGSITGTEVISLRTTSGTKSIVLNAGNLHVDRVEGKYVAGFKQSLDRLRVDLSATVEVDQEIRIDYHGTPTHGLFFNKDLDQAYTVYSTSEWMICNDVPDDKATFHLNLVVPGNTDCVASGRLVSVTRKNEKVIYSWSQDYESPTYTYGFAIGHFNKAETRMSNVTIGNYAQHYSSEELKRIFRETPKMISFFQDKSGIDYDQPVYSQVLMGNHYQEMSGFSVLRASYGHLVLKDSTETNLMAHELAHQWWGNRITCRNWSHFWLNEAFATYMSAAFNEYLFGKDKYNADIDSYFRVYQEIKMRNNDKSLVFRDWTNPSRDDRNLVYFKGAYVLHLLREEIGDQYFWNGIKSYSQQYFGKSVETIDFQKAMEEGSGRSLRVFFDQWVYGREEK